MMEDDTAHAATGCGQSTFLDADDTTVFRVVGGEVTGKRQQVVRHTVLIACRTFGDLSGTSLAGHLERCRSGFLSESLADHMLQHHLHFLDDSG